MEEAIEYKKICKCGDEYITKVKRQFRCYPCKREYDREFHKNKDEAARQKKRDKKALFVKRNREFLMQYLSDKCCSVCSENDPVVLEFDHLERDQKHSEISIMISANSIATLLAEIAKCRILCCNCHRKHTSKQMGYWKENFGV